MMTEEQKEEQEIKAIIKDRRARLRAWSLTAYKLTELRDEGFPEDLYNEVMARVSSKIAMCEISIRDHEKLLGCRQPD